MDIANSPAIAAAIPDPTISEPISPELALVDPELRRALLVQAAREAQAELERGRLQVVPDVEPAPAKPTPEPEPLERSTLVELAQPPAGVPLPPLAPRPPAWRDFSTRTRWMPMAASAKGPTAVPRFVTASTTIAMA